MQKIIGSIFLFLFYSLPLIGQNSCPGITFTSQSQIDNFQENYPGCTEILGNVTINGDSIYNLYGLDVLTSINGDLVIGDEYNLNFANQFLGDLTGLEELVFIGNDFIITWNMSLSSLNGLESLSIIEGDLEIFGNEPLASITGLESLTYVGGDLEIDFCPALTSLEGLEGLTAVEGDLEFNGNWGLTNLEGLDNVANIGGEFRIWFNKYLTSLMGLENLISIGGDFIVDYNDALLDFSSLENITSINGDINISNNEMLGSMNGLDNIDAGSIIDITIVNNYSLNSCHVQSICDYLVTPNGTVVIEGNAPGCNSIEEVEEACLEVGIEESKITSFILYPNPTDNGIITITLDNPHNIHLTCFNTFGQQVHQQEITGKETVIDVSNWSPGIYLAVVYEWGKPVGRSKLMVR